MPQVGKAPRSQVRGSSIGVPWKWQLAVSPQPTATKRNRLPRPRHTAQTKAPGSSPSPAGVPVHDDLSSVREVLHSNPSVTSPFRPLTPALCPFFSPNSTLHSPRLSVSRSALRTPLRYRRRHHSNPTHRRPSAHCTTAACKPLAELTPPQPLSPARQPQHTAKLTFSRARHRQADGIRHCHLAAIRISQDLPFIE